MKLLQLWNRYWFRPGSLFNLAVVRVLIVAFQLRVLLESDYLEDILYYTTLPEFRYSPLAVVKLLLPFGLGRPDNALLITVYWVTIIAGFLALVGLFTNPSLFIFGIGNIFLTGFVYSFGDYHHTEAILMMATVLLSLSPTGKVFSLDEFFSQRRAPEENRRFNPDRWLYAKSPYATWSILVIQWLFALIYFSSAFSKLTKGGLDWLNGYTLQYYMVRDGLLWGSDLGVFLGQFHWPAVILSWITVIFEATFFLVLPFSRLALIYVPVGIALHMGIYLTMRAPFFTFIVLYSVFIPWSVLLRVLLSKRRKANILPGVRV